MKLEKENQVAHYISKIAALTILLEEANDHILLLKQENRELRETARELLSKQST